MLQRCLTTQRSFSSKPVSTSQVEDVIKEKGRGDEDTYFNRKDRENLRKLLEKIEDTTADPEDLRKVQERQREKLMGVLRTHSLRVSEVVIEDLLRWKRGEI
jgi:hypothetical protein